MSLSSSQIMGSRSAPRDQEDISGRRPVSVFHDRRQYRMAEDSDEEDRMPPRKESALSSKDKHYRTKAIHRSFASTPAAARFSPARTHTHTHARTAAPSTAISTKRAGGRPPHSTAPARRAWSGPRGSLPCTIWI